MPAHASNKSSRPQPPNMLSERAARASKRIRAGSRLHGGRRATPESQPMRKAEAEKALICFAALSEDTIWVGGEGRCRWRNGR